MSRAATRCRRAQCVRLQSAIESVRDRHSNLIAEILERPEHLGLGQAKHFLDCRERSRARLVQDRDIDLPDRQTSLSAELVGEPRQVGCDAGHRLAAIHLKLRSGLEATAATHPVDAGAASFEPAGVLEGAEGRHRTCEYDRVVAIACRFPR